MINLVKLFLVFIFTTSVFGQQEDYEESKTNQNLLIYIEGFGGISAISDIGVAGGVELNCQYKKNLFTFRHLDITGFKQEIVSPILPLPIYYETKNDKEYALLYGLRWLQNNHSYSISAGISYNHFSWNDTYIDGNYFVNQENYFGFPFEANVKWFHSKKRSKLIFDSLIPSIGIKIFGSISKNTFLGVGVSVGFGLHKKYY
jgi:hypothetical protein